MNGQLLLSGRVIGIRAVSPVDLSVRWQRTPAELGGSLVPESLDFGRIGTIALAKNGSANERFNLDVRTGEVDRGATANAVVRGAVQFPVASGFAVNGATQIFLSNGFAAAVRNGAQLWSYPRHEGPVRLRGAARGRGGRARDGVRHVRRLPARLSAPARSSTDQRVVSAVANSCTSCASGPGSS